MSQKNSNPEPTSARPAPPPNPPAARTHESELVEFFRGDGYLDFGLRGDNMCWSPERTAIEAMRELRTLRATRARLAVCGFEIFASEQPGQIYIRHASGEFGSFNAGEFGQAIAAFFRQRRA